MKTRIIIINVASLAAIASLLVGLAAAGLAFTGGVDLATYKIIFNLSSLAWFLSSPFWFVPQLFGPGFEQAGNQAWLRPRARD